MYKNHNSDCYRGSVCIAKFCITKYRDLQKHCQALIGIHWCTQKNMAMVEVKRNVCS